MKGKQLAVVSVIGAFSLLVLLLSPAMRPIENTAQQEIGGPAPCIVLAQTRTVYLAEVKTRIGGVGASTVSRFIGLLQHFQLESQGNMEQQKLASGSLPRPIWLLNRSLLI